MFFICKFSETITWFSLTISCETFCAVLPLFFATMSDGDYIEEMFAASVKMFQ